MRGSLKNTPPEQASDVKEYNVLSALEQNLYSFPVVDPMENKSKTLTSRNTNTRDLGKLFIFIKY